MNNATAINTLFTNFLPNIKLLNNRLDDFLIINLTDRQDALLLDNQFEQELNLDQQNLTNFDQFNSSNFDLELYLNNDNLTNYTINLNETLNENQIITVHHPLLAIFLACICIFIIFGNLLIIVAVRKSRQLRQQTTNYFVISLAFSDFLVGLIVMPFSVVQEVLNKVWPFGDLWCDLWHSFDVLGTTSSILSLCVISIDRYYAITKPFDYAVKMTPSKAKLLIVLIFIVSSLLSFPAIFWWRAISIYKPYTCSFPVSTGYIVFSSTLSFYGPLCVMIVSYYRIYKAAVEQTRSLKTGAKTISYTSNIYHAGSGNNLGHFDNGQFSTGKSSSGDYIPDHMITLRMHRGGNYNDSISSKLNTNLKIENNRKNLKQRKPFSLASSSTKNRSSTSLDRLASVFCNMRHEYSKQEENTNASGSKADLDSNNENKIANECEEENRKKNSFESQVTGGNKNQVNNAWSISRKVSKLAKERKAAKTLGIVMGVFILMWAPFFITHIVMGICAQNCDINEDLVYSIVTWLGWLNSACNPIIYVCWSRDFRRAFKKVLCGFRESKQRSSTGYSSYYFSSKFNQTPGSMANKKRPLIGDRHFNFQNRHTNNKLTSIKQNNLTSSSNQQSKNRGLNKFKNSKEISTIDELDDSLEISATIQKSSQDRNSPTPSNKPSESKSSPNLMSISNVIKENDDDDDNDFKVINDKPYSETKKEQSNLMSIEKQLSLNKVISKEEQLDIENNNQSNNLNNQQLLKEEDVKKEIKENNLYVKNENKLDKESGNRFSLGNWFSNSKGNKRDIKEEDKKQTNYLKRKHSKQLENSEDKKINLYNNQDLVNNRHVDKIKSNNEKFNKNNKKFKDKTNQANDNNLSSIDSNLKLSFGNSCSNNKLIENNIDNLNEQITDHLIAHNQKQKEDQLINNNDGRLTSPYYKITAECTKSNLDNKLKDNLNTDKNDLEEEFFIKIQLEPR